MSAPTMEIRVTRDLFLWCMAVIFLFAFTSLFVQIPGLYGDNGILPAKLVLEQDAESFSDLISHQPTLLRLLPCIGFDVEAGMNFLCLGGSLLSFVAIVSRDQRNCVVFAVLWMFYLSMFQVGQTFLWFQWDVLLLEVGFLTILVAPLNFFGLHDTVWYHAHDKITFYLVRWLLFRLTFAAGFVKLISNSASWWTLTAIKSYYESQFLPTPVAWHFHQLPEWIQRLSAVGVLTTQTVGSLMMLSPVRHQRIIAFYSQVLLLSLMTLTGNYGFFTLLILTLCLSLIDDEWLTSWTGHSLKVNASNNVQNSETWTAKVACCGIAYAVLLCGVVRFFGLHISTDPLGVESNINFSFDDVSCVVYLLVPLTACVGAYSVLSEIVSAALSSYYNKKFNRSKRLTELVGCTGFGLAAIAVFALSLVSHTKIASNVHDTLPQTLRDMQTWTTKNYRLTSPYIFFTRSIDDESDGRSEIILEGSHDMNSGWKEYRFRFKPGSISDRLPIVSPHQPRLDWQMWFAARSNYKQNHWFLNLAYRLLTNQQEVLELIGENPFPEEPPKYIKASLYTYRFTVRDKNSELYSASNWWTREKVGDYLPIVSLDEQSFVEYLYDSSIYRQPTDEDTKPTAGWKSVIQGVLSRLRSLLGQNNGSCTCLMLVTTGFLLTLFDPSVALLSTQPLQADGTALYDMSTK